MCCPGADVGAGVGASVGASVGAAVWAGVGGAQVTYESPTEGVSGPEMINPASVNAYHYNQRIVDDNKPTSEKR